MDTEEELIIDKAELYKKFVKSLEKEADKQWSLTSRVGVWNKRCCLNCIGLTKKLITKKFKCCLFQTLSFPVVDQSYQAETRRASIRVVWAVAAEVQLLVKNKQRLVSVRDPA